MPNIVNEQEQTFIKAMRDDDFNTILELKMKGYQPSENVLKSLQPDISATNFIAAAKIFQMVEVLKSIHDIKPAQSPIIGGNKRSMELGKKNTKTTSTIQYNSKYINYYLLYFDLTVNIFTFAI